jgi:hypothetical protein
VDEGSLSPPPPHTHPLSPARALSFSFLPWGFLPVPTFLFHWLAIDNVITDDGMMRGGRGREKGETTIVSSQSKFMRDDERGGLR